MFDFRNFTPKTPMYKSKVIWDLVANVKQKLMEKITTGNNVEIVYCWLALPCRGNWPCFLSLQFFCHVFVASLIVVLFSEMNMTHFMTRA